MSGLLLMLSGQFKIFYNPKNDPVGGYVLIMLIGLGLFLAAAWHFVSDNPETVTANIEFSQARDATFSIRPLWLCVSIACIVFTTWRATLQPPQAHLSEHLLLWLSSMIALILAIRQREMSRQDRFGLVSQDYQLLIILLFAALALRVVGLDSVPQMLDQDEAQFAMNGVQILKSHFIVSPYEPGVLSFPSLFQAMIGFSINIIGQTLVGARMPSAIFGALGIPAVYLLGHELFGRRVALVAALFMLTWPLHLHFSRLALNQPVDPVFTTLAFYFLLVGLRRGWATGFVLSGICLGIAQLFYLGGRLAPLAMLAYIGFLWFRERPLIARQWKLLLLIPLAIFIVTLPQNYYLLHFGLPFTTRTWPVLIGADKTYMNDIQWLGWGDQLNKSFMAFLSTPDTLWYGTSSNLMGPFAGSFLLIGVLWSIIMIWKHPRLALPLGWGLAVTLAGSTLTILPPQYQRYFPGVTAFALLVAVGLSWAVRSSLTLLSRSHFREGLLVAAGGVICVANLIFYVGIFVPEAHYFANRPNKVTNQLASMMTTSFDAGQQIVLVTNTEPKTDQPIAKIPETAAVFYSTGVDNTNVVRYSMADRNYTVIADGFSLDQLDAVDFHKPFAIFIPLLYRDQFDELWTKKVPGGEAIVIEIQDENERKAAFFVYRSIQGIP